MRLVILALAVLVCAPACQSTSETPTPTSVEIATVPPVDETSNVEFTRDGLTVSLPKPAGWESFRTEYGVVVAEKFGTVADLGKLHGVMAYVFVMPASGFDVPTPQAPFNLAEHILEQIVVDKAFIGAAHASSPVGFDWDGHAAAYYLLTDPEAGVKTIVIGVSIPNSGSLLISTLSAPLDDTQTLRTALYNLFGTLTVNGVGMDEQALNVLPDPLPFP